MPNPPLHLFEAVGIELEYMIVTADGLDVYPVADALLFQAAEGEFTGDVEFDGFTWSNELVSHVIELKVSEPAKSFEGLASGFADQVSKINSSLGRMGGRLMPGGMHPWMDPARETRLWPHEGREIYDTYDRIFDCRRHGWANLQSAHINLPFHGDAEFAKLHAAIRLLLPILPAIAASSPIMAEQVTGHLDTRLDVYRTNSAKVPSLAGRMIPEAIFSQADYQKEIFDRTYADITPHDPEGLLRGQFLNSRGAIARFDRGSIEIRVLDVQECPAADLAISAAVVAVLQSLVAESWQTLAPQQAWETETLRKIFLAVARDGERTVIENRDYLRAFGLRDHDRATAGDLWRHLFDQCVMRRPESAAAAGPLKTILDEGPLARRLLKALGDPPEGAVPDHGLLFRVCDQLAGCLADGKLFDPAAAG